MFAIRQHLSESEYAVKFAVQDLIRDGEQPTAARIASICDDMHLPTIETTRSRLIRRGVVVLPDPIDRVGADTIPARDVAKIVTLPKRSSLDRILSISPIATNRVACREMVLAFKTL